MSALGIKINPAVISIIVVLSLLFFIAAVLHLLIRLFMKIRSPQPNDYPEMSMSNSGAFQRQLQHLFHLQDSGLDQAHIDALPVFVYKDIAGSKEPFDCAVCLCEFTEVDQLRLLPLCSHAFHIGCIDTWLLSNSTCPLCREVVLSPVFSFENPVFYIENQKENEGGSPGYSVPCVVKNSEEDNSAAINDKRVFSVRLGKLKSTQKGAHNAVEIGETSNSNLDARRCYSMGSFQYVVDGSELQVALCPRSRERDREHGGGGPIGNFTSEVDGGDSGGKKVNNIGAKGESFSVSKIWMWSKKGKFHGSTGTAPTDSNSVDVSLP